MKNKKLITAICLIIMLSITMTSAQLLSVKSAEINDEPVSANYTTIANNKEFYLKNANSGQYLDLDHGTDANNTNIHQWKYKGGKNQRWKFVYVKTVSYVPLYKIVSADSSSGRVIDISKGGSSNDLNVALYQYKGSDNQLFALQATTNRSYAILSKCSNYKSGLTVKSMSCSEGGNVVQYVYGNASTDNDEWYLEPVNKEASYGVAYANHNFYQKPDAYPFLESLEGSGSGDCANFVSQCMAASGIHYQNNWYVYKKSNSYHIPKTINELNKGWQLAYSSSWISAINFEYYWHRNSAHTDIISKNNLSAAKEKGYYNAGDIVQYGTYDGWRFKPKHTMYITGYDVYNKSYIIAAHTGSVNNKLLKETSGSTFKFFDVI